MNFEFSKIRPQSRLAKILWVASLLISLALLLVPFVFRLDGKTHADWQQFLGRFHPLVIHLPIGLILLVPLLEVAGVVRPALREAAAFVLALCIPASLSAVLLGYLLAYGSGDIGVTVTRHMWGGIALSIAVMLCALARPTWSIGALDGPLRFAYPSLMALTILLLAWTAHQGGSLTHGDTYLSQYMPAPLKRLLRVGDTANSSSASGSFYVKQIHPILDANCVACHGASSIKGGLRLDSYEAMMKGGEEGAVVLPGNPEKSILLQRITLPTDHKKFMPAEGKPPLKADEIALIQTWIAQGASGSATTLSGVAVREEETPPPPVGDYSKLLGEVQQTAKAAGVTVTQVSRNPGDGLILNTIDASANFGDAQLASFTKFAPYIVELGLARTAVTDASFDTLAKFTQLHALHLEDTAITGAGLQKLASLQQLRYLNLSGTKVSAATITPLSAMKQLRHVYLFNTPAQPSMATPEEPGKARQAL